MEKFHDIVVYDEDYYPDESDDAIGNVSSVRQRRKPSTD